jgi:hypothetical protein
MKQGKEGGSIANAAMQNLPNPCKRLKARRGEEEVPQEERAGGESNKL